MTTAAERLLSLSGISGQPASASLKAIGHGAGLAAAALLVAYSGLASATAAVHLLTDQAATVVVGGGGSQWTPHQLRLGTHDRDEEELMLIITAALHTLENQ